MCSLFQRTDTVVFLFDRLHAPRWKAGVRVALKRLLFTQVRAYSIASQSTRQGLTRACVTSIGAFQGIIPTMSILCPVVWPGGSFMCTCKLSHVHVTVCMFSK